jgi:hypothetical protein
MAPALLAVCLTLVAPALRGAVAAVSSMVVVGVGFAVVTGTQSGANFASAAWSAVSGPSLVRADPTDLLALPALAVAWWTWRLVAGHPAPDRVVRLVRVCVVLPAAALATMATSALPSPPEATSVSTDAGKAVVETGRGMFATVDGTTWHPLDPSPGDNGGRPTDAGAPGGPQACVPDQPTHCYRVVAGRLAVEESDDGMATWRIAWEISEGRRAFLIRGYEKDEIGTGFHDGPIEKRLTSRALVVVGSGEHHVVVVANGPDGYLVRDSEGSWQRLGFFGEDSGLREAPLALTAPWLWIGPEYVVGLGVAAAVFSLAVELGRRRRGWAAWTDKGAQVAVAIGVAAAAAETNDALGFTLLLAVAFLVLGLIAWLIFLILGAALSGRQVAFVLPPVLLTGAAVIAPFVGWSAGWPDDHGNASLYALTGGAALAIVTVAAAWYSRRWAAPPAEHLADPPWPPVSPTV